MPWHGFRRTLNVVVLYSGDRHACMHGWAVLLAVVSLDIRFVQLCDTFTIDSRLHGVRHYVSASEVIGKSSCLSRRYAKNPVPVDHMILID